MRPTHAAFLLAALALPGLSGCLERRIRITSQPPGALVRLNDVDVGRTPLEVDFTYYGVYDVRLSKEGYEPLLTSAEAEAPWYETPGIDLVAEAMPGRNVVLIEWDFRLTPLEVDADGVAPREPLIERARELRTRLSPPPETPAEADPAQPPG